MPRPKSRRSWPHSILHSGPAYPPDSSHLILTEPAPGELVGPHLLRTYEQVLKPRSDGDPATFLIQAHLTGGGNELQLRTGWELIPQISAAATQFGASHLQPLSGPDGWRTLADLAEAVRVMMRQMAADYDPAYWYALIKRAEPILLTQHADICRRAIPEILAAAYASHRRSSLIGFVTAPWRVAHNVMDDLGRLIFLGLLVSHVETAKRRIGKGQEVALNHETLFSPVFDPNTPVAAAIDLYDARARASPEGQAAMLGAYGASIGTAAGEWPIVMWGSLLFDDALRGPLVHQALRNWDPIFPMVANLKQVVPAAFLPGSAGLTAEAQAVAVFLNAYSELVINHKAALRFSRHAWSRFGYAVRTRHEFERAFRKSAAVHPALSDGWVAGSLNDAIQYLFNEKLILELGKRHLILNGAMASSALALSFHRPAEGGEANVWAGAFEDEVQQLIDMTTWRPPEDFRTLIRRDININGKRVTDIDAVAYYDGVLLLIDCKSYKNTDRLAAGEYSAVLTLRQKAEKASADWARRIEAISHNRHSLPVRIPKEVSIAGVVVVPFTPFLLPGAATETVVGGLRAVSTVGELMLFLTSVRIT
ncbi:hypothetical protein [Actinoplanes sp. NPDC049316]|uniref:hypothetical protein n=1 Tax=Actinoplanes sp. NPDC049316 TaxID=3154727 RepID=UPI003421E7BB